MEKVRAVMVGVGMFGGAIVGALVAFMVVGFTVAGMDRLLHPKPCSVALSTKSVDVWTCTLSDGSTLTVTIGRGIGGVGRKAGE